MPDRTKIATCSYCASRTMLRVAQKGRHELSCGNCGAPLHDMKPLKVERPHDIKRMPLQVPRGGYVPARKRRKPPKRNWDFWEELWDKVEDVVEEIFD